jgi:hypothetical protein
VTCGNVGYLPPSVPPLEQAAVTKQSHKPAAPLCSSGSCLQRRTAAESFFIPQAMRWVGAGQASAESDVVESAVVSQVTVPILSTATRSPAVGLRPSRDTDPSSARRATTSGQPNVPAVPNGVTCEKALEPVARRAVATSPRLSREEPVTQYDKHGTIGANSPYHTIRNH